MDRLANIIAFITVAETGSFSDAARRLRLSNSVISKRIKDIEVYLGATLLQRTTRHVSLTEAGHVYAARARTLLDGLAEVEENLRYQNENPVGALKISVPSDFGSGFLGSAVAAFLEKYPDVTVRLSARDGFIEEGFDLAVCIGAFEGEGIVARPLAQSRRVVVAAPSYIDRFGRPEKPEELSRHNCLLSTEQENGAGWRFMKDGKVFRQRVQGRFTAESGALLAAAAQQGCGIALLPTFIIGAHIVSGALVPLLEEYEAEPLPIQVIYRQKGRIGIKAQRFIDHLAFYFSEGTA